MADFFDPFTAINKLQLHYWFSDKAHSMDALVHNKGERELLEIVKAIAKICNVTVIIDTEPSGKGGLRNWFTIKAKSPKKTSSDKIALVTLLSTASLVTPNNASIAQLVEDLLGRLFIEKEFDDDKKEQLQLAISHLRIELVSKIPLIDQSSLVKKRRSNFYDLIRKYPRVKSVSVSVADDARKPVTEDKLVNRDSFKSFVLSSDQLEPLVLENAAIEIISPVLMKGRHKWKGMYNGSPISFIMKSDEFMSLVHSGKVEFKSGSTITCALEIEKKINGVGVEKMTGYNIIRVSSYFENGKTIETAEGKQHQQKQNTVSKRQLNLFG